MCPFLACCLVVAGLCLGQTATLRAEKVAALSPRGYVNDFAQVLDGATQSRLQAICAEVDEKTHAQISIVTIRSLDGDSIEDFAVRLYQQWGIGYKGENRGALILLALNERRYRVEVGYRLEPILPDGKVGGFGREIAPLLRQGNYGAALEHLTWRIAQTIAADRGVTLSASPPSLGPTGAPGARASGLLIGWILLLFIWLFLGGVFRPMLGALGGGRRRVRAGGWWMMGPWLGGGGSWGGGGFGGAGGGFGGFGGGVSGGGGASGSW